MAMMVTILFVCYENICRSPMAEGIFGDLLARNNLQHLFSVSSAGTVSFQQGSSPDERAIAALSSLGIDISSLRARSVEELDLHDYDWIFVMDDENYWDIHRYFTPLQRPRVHLVLEFVPGRSGEEISDPYYGSAKEFDRVMNDLVVASEQILARMFEEYPYLSGAGSPVRQSSQ